MDAEERERKLQAGRERLAKFQQKKTKKGSKKSKAQKPLQQDIHSPPPEPLFPSAAGSEALIEAVAGDSFEPWSGGDAQASFSALDGGNGFERGLSDEHLPLFASDEFASQEFGAGGLKQNGKAEDVGGPHNDLLNDLRRELKLERDTRQRSEEQLRHELSSQATAAQELARQLEQSKLAASDHHATVQHMHSEHADVVRQMQLVHEQEVSSVRADEQRKRAEQVQSLTSRLESQHKEDADALREQVRNLQNLQADAPSDTGELQQMATLMREQYQQESASKATEHKRELTALQEKHGQELADLQQQSMKQMEVFRSQVQESVTTQVNQFHSQYQVAIAEQRSQLETAVQSVSTLQSEKAELSEKLSACSATSGELCAANESLSERLSTLTGLYDADKREVVALRQQVSANHVAGHRQELEAAQTALQKFEIEKADLLAGVAQLETELEASKELLAAQEKDMTSQRLRIEQQESNAQQPLMEELDTLQQQCLSHVDAALLESEKSLVASVTADLEKALSAQGILEGQLQSLRRDYDAERQRSLDREQELENELNQEQDKYETLQDSHHQLQHQMQESLSQYARQVEELAAAACEDSTASSALSELRAAYEDQFEQLRLDFEAKEEALKQQQRRELADLTARQASSSSAILKELEDERSHLQECDTELTQVKDDLCNVAEERSALQTRNTWLEQRVEELSGQNLTSIAEARVRYDDLCRRHDIEKSAWTATEAEMREQVAVLERDLATTKRQLAESEAVAREQPHAADIAAKLQSSEAERHQMHQRLLELEASASSWKGADESVNECRGEIARLGKQLEEKDGELLDRNDECARLEGELSQSLSDLAQMQSRLDRMLNEIESHRTNAGKLAQERRQLLDSHEEQLAGLNSQVCQLEKALSEQEQAASAKTARLAELESRVVSLESCEDDLKLATSELEILRSRVAFLQPPALEAVDGPAPVHANRQEHLQSMLDEQRQALQSKLAEKTRLDQLLEEQRNALVQQLLEKNKLESMLEEKNKLEGELLRQRGLLENELLSLDKPVTPDLS